MARLPPDVGLDPTIVKLALNRSVPPQVESLFITDTFAEGHEEGEELLDVAMLSHDGWLVLTTIYQSQVLSQTHLANRLSGIEFTMGEVTANVNLIKPGGQSGFTLFAEVKSATFNELSDFLGQLQRAMAG